MDIFTDNQDISKTAFLNWRTNDSDTAWNYHVMADGFMRSALILAKHALDDNTDKKADILIFPILFCANHSIELYFKSTLLLAKDLLNLENSFPGTHDLRDLFCELQSRIEKLGGEPSSFNQHTEDLRVYFDELYQRVPRKGQNDNRIFMDFPRYSENENKNPHFYILETENVTVDLVSFIKRFENIQIILNSLYCYLDTQREKCQKHDICSIALFYYSWLAFRYPATMMARRKNARINLQQI